MQNFNEWVLITTRNQEFIKLVLFLNSQTPAEELEREAGTTLKADTGICHWFLFQSFYLAIAAWGAQIIQVPNHHNTGQKSFYEARKPSRIAPGLNDSFCSALLCCAGDLSAGSGSRWCTCLWECLTYWFGRKHQHFILPAGFNLDRNWILIMVEEEKEWLHIPASWAFLIAGHKFGS